MKVLSQEEFDAKAVLASLGVEIAKGRGELSTLQAQKKDFLEERMREADIASQNLSEKSLKALEEAKSYQDELTLYAKDLTNYASELKGFREKEEEVAKDFEEKAKATQETLRNSSKELQELAQEIKIGKEKIVKERESLRVKEILLHDERKELESERAAIQHAFDEGRKKGFL